MRSRSLVRRLLLVLFVKLLLLAIRSLLRLFIRPLFRSLIRSSVSVRLIRIRLLIVSLVLSP